jgi:hypothetical protein
VIYSCKIIFIPVGILSLFQAPLFSLAGFFVRFASDNHKKLFINVLIC